MSWSIADSRNMYGIRHWGAGYYDIGDNGHVSVHPHGKYDETALDIYALTQDLRARGLALPLLVRFPDILQHRVRRIIGGFDQARAKLNYDTPYTLLYPIKVNQQQEVIEEITRYGRKYHYGLEAGSKPELIAALSYMHDPEAYIVCNGYKDEEFIDLALYAQKMGLQVILVLEMPTELDLILERCEKMGVRPTLGVRFRLSAVASMSCFIGAAGT